ncbi:MAG TPA: sulfotransferase [Gammaproteobacteria bacterium]|nr:sulfotransferase [Gammaproteobacteria bacterium]
MSLVFFLPEERKISIERWLRGRGEFLQLREADCVIVSYGKSGRTWLRVMLSRFYQVRHGLSEKNLIAFDNLKRKDPAIPAIFFTHDNYLKDYTGQADSKAYFQGRKIILLVRDPRDVAVSQFFQWKYRMRPRKKRLNQYPLHGEEVSLYDFIMNPDAGLPKIIDFMNLWAREMSRMDNVLVVRYEDMRANTVAVLRRIVEFIGTPGTDEQLREAVRFASVENMKKLEQQKTFWLSGTRMVPKDRKNPDSYKVRRAKVGGYRDYFEDREIETIERLVNDRLAPAFGYTAAERTPAENTATA